MASSSPSSSRRFHKAAKFLSRSRIYTLSLIELISIILIGFGVIYAQNINNAPTIAGRTVDQTTLIFYLGTMPLLSILHGITELMFYTFNSPLTTGTTILLTTLLTSGWLTQGVFWVECEGFASHNDIPTFCPQSALIRTTNGKGNEYGAGFEILAKDVAVWVVVAMYLVHLGLAVTVFVQQRGSTVEVDDLEQDQESPRLEPLKDELLVSLYDRVRMEGHSAQYQGGEGGLQWMPAPR